jgi:hypothetical protein
MYTTQKNNYTNNNPNEYNKYYQNITHDLDNILIKHVRASKADNVHNIFLINSTEHIYEYIEGNHAPEFIFKFELDSVPSHYQFVRIVLKQIESHDEDYNIVGAKAKAFPSSFKFFANSMNLNGSFVVRGQKGVFSLNIFCDGKEIYQPIQTTVVIKINEIYNDTPKQLDFIKYNIMPEKIIDIKTLYKKNVYVIQNVYQELYKGNLKPTGFGDFIRGCYFLMQFCNSNKLKYNIIINHPIALFLKKFEEFYKNNELNKEFNKIFLNINKFEKVNFQSSKINNEGYIIGENIDNNTTNEFINYLCNMDVINHNIFIYNILFPYNEIQVKEKNYMKNLLQPTEEMTKYINETLFKLEIQKGNYMVIHIRCGDQYISEKSSIFTKKYIKKIFHEISEIVRKNLNMNYLLISDNNLIKNLVKKYLFKNIKLLYNSITHLGETKVLDLEKVKNTMLDFYLLANSCFIHSISVYIHGSGFSFWCAKTYNIPYNCKIINL